MIWRDVRGAVCGCEVREGGEVVRDEKIESLFDEYGDEICKVCPWQEESHLPDVLCEGCCCEEAAEVFAEILEQQP